MSDNQINDLFAKLIIKTASFGRLFCLIKEILKFLGDDTTSGVFIYL